jgi:hypothetical protein
VRLGRPRAEFRARMATTTRTGAGYHPNRVQAALGRVSRYRMGVELPKGGGPFLVAYARESGTEGYNNRSRRRANARRKR